MVVVTSIVSTMMAATAVHVDLAFNYTEMARFVKVNSTIGRFPL
jgi:hypothetical protein